MDISQISTIVEQIIAPKSLNKVQRIVLEKSWEGLSYRAIADQSDYEEGYIKDTGSDLWKLLSQAIGQPVTKTNLRGILYQLQQPQISPQRINWGEAIDVRSFYGRTSEQETLTQWIIGDQCRLVGIFAFGGMGKTALSVKITQAIEAEFEVVTWQSLRDTPPLGELLPPLLRFLANDPNFDIPESPISQISALIKLLQERRSLIVFDNFDSLFATEKSAGSFRDGYQLYGELLTRLGEINHQSCVLITSREEPLEFAALAGENRPVRRLKLEGLNYDAGQQLLQHQGIQLTFDNAQKIVDSYQGNPLALKISATAIQELFKNNIDDFLSENITVLSGISHFIDQQIKRLSILEQAILFWLAIEREPIPFSELSHLLFPSVTSPNLIATVESLQRRSLVESSQMGFTLQPVVMEFMTEYLIQTITTEISSGKLAILRSHALIKATSKDYIRETQIRLILTPIIDSLLTIFDNQLNLKKVLNQLIKFLQQDYRSESNYGAGNIVNLLRQLKIDFTGYDFSGLTLRQAYLLDTNLYQVNLSHGELRECVLAETFGGITDVAFSQDGSLLATSDTLGDLQIWDSRHFQKIACCRGHVHWVWSVCFNHDGTRLISGGQDQTVRIWDAMTGHCLQVLQGHQGIVTSVILSPDGELIASSSQDQTVKLWSLKTGELLKTFGGHQGCVWSVRFTLDGRSLISGSEDRTIRRWDVVTGNCEGVFAGHGHWIWGLAVHPDGQTFASSSFDRTIKLWDLATGACLQTLRGHTQPVTAIAFAPDGQTLASGSYDQTVRLWQINIEKCIGVLKKHTSLVWSVAFDPNGERLASGGDDHGTCIWQLGARRCTKILKGHSNCIYSIALSPDRRGLASAHESQVINVWQQPDGSEQFKLVQTLREHRGRILSVVFSPDGEYLISGSCDHTVKIWQISTGKCIQTLNGHLSWIWCVAISPDGNIIASGSYDHTIKLWDRETGNCLGTLIGHPSSILAVKFSPDGQYLVSGGYDQVIKIWRIETQTCEGTLTAHSNRIWSVDFRGDGQLLATGGDDCTVKIWDWQKRLCLQTLVGHSSQILSVLFSADGQSLFSASGDNTIKIWDIKTGICLHTLTGHDNWVSTLQEDGDRQWLLSASNDETIKIWDNSEKNHPHCRQTLRTIRPYEGMKIANIRSLTEAQQVTLLALGAIQDSTMEA